jgi:hypothetical protein
MRVSLAILGRDLERALALAWQLPGGLGRTRTKLGVSATSRIAKLWKRNVETKA